MTISEVLPIILYILGAVLLVTLIILTIRLIITMNKVDKIVDNIDGKIRSVDALFSVIDLATNSLASITDKFVDNITLIFKKIFNSKRKEDENE